ncbi:hypothetical protein [Phytohabitans kaempferiae]|uniref:Lipoprotein n=1 Tax=Phytohabitans kaempferiae TaxID=1620943 RepID=A0ABV6M4W1_9ACTN
MAAALAASLSACAGTDAVHTAARTDDAAPSIDVTATQPPARISLMQHIGDNTRELRRLTVEPDGGWSCDNCAGDQKNSQGRLSPAQNDELHRLVGSPEFRQEVLDRRGRRYTCEGALYSSLFMIQGAITVGDCPGEERLPVTDAVLRLLADATPVEIARSVAA